MCGYRNSTSRGGRVQAKRYSMPTGYEVFYSLEPFAKHVRQYLLASSFQSSLEDIYSMISANYRFVCITFNFYMLSPIVNTEMIKNGFSIFKSPHFHPSTHWIMHFHMSKNNDFKVTNFQKSLTLKPLSKVSIIIRVFLVILVSMTGKTHKKV